MCHLQGVRGERLCQCAKANPHHFVIVRGAKVSDRKSLVRRDDYHADAGREHARAGGAERCRNDLGIDGILAEANRWRVAHAARGREDGVRRLRRRFRHRLQPSRHQGWGGGDIELVRHVQAAALRQPAPELGKVAGGGASRSGFDLSLVNSNAALITSSNAATTMSSDILCCPGSAAERRCSSAAARLPARRVALRGPRRRGLRRASRCGHQIHG